MKNVMLQNSVEQEVEEEEKSSQGGDYLHPAQILQRYPQRIYSIIFVSLGYPSLVMKELCMAKMHFPLEMVKSYIILLKKIY